MSRIQILENMLQCTAQISVTTCPFPNVNAMLEKPCITCIYFCLYPTQLLKLRGYQVLVLCLLLQNLVNSTFKNLRYKHRHILTEPILISTGSAEIVAFRITENIREDRWHLLPRLMTWAQPLSPTEWKKTSNAAPNCPLNSCGTLKSAHTHTHTHK